MNTDDKNRKSKKLAKVRRQREYWRNQYNKVSEILRMFPYIKEKFRMYSEQKEYDVENLRLKNACQGYERTIRILEHKLKWLEKEINDLKEPK